MATPAAIQAAGDSANTMFVWRIEKSVPVGINTAHYVTGICAPYAGRSRWVTILTAADAATSAAAVNAALTAN